MEYAFENDVKFEIIRRFPSEMEANIYASKLKLSKISCFISNSAMSTMLPFNDGFTLHVDAKRKMEAEEILKKIDAQVQTFEEDFHEADLDDIQYQKELYEESHLTKSNWQVVAFIVIAIVLILLFRYFSAFTGWDLF